MLIAGPNLTIDRTLSLDELVPGEVLRCTDAAITPGGKGVNVARVAKALRAPALLVSFVPGRTGQAVASLIADEGLALAGVSTGGEIRSAAILLERDGRVTVVNEPGAQIGDRDWARYEEQVERHLGDHGVLVCSGSVPPGAPEEAYRALVCLAHARSVPVVVDATGPALARSLEAEPDIVSPNVTEAETALGGREASCANRESDIGERALGAARALVERGARTAIVTAGERGLAVAGGTTPKWMAAPEVAVRNPVGAGDSFVGGLAAWLERGERLDDAVAVGMAAAASSVESMLAGDVDVGRMGELVRRALA